MALGMARRPWAYCALEKTRRVNVVVQGADWRGIQPASGARDRLRGEFER